MKYFHFFSIVCSMLMSILSSAQITYENFFQNINFEYPVEIACPDDGSNRMFVVEQRGRIKNFPIKSNVVQSEVNTFLDITQKVSFSEGQEIGLLGFAFHPNYINNKYFYIFYTVDSPLPNINTRIVLSRFRTSSTNDNFADPNSELILFQFDKNQTNSNHNGGKIAFGPDSYLYISFGDGGGANDPQNNGQDKNNVFGSLCRIDVDVNGDNSISSNGNYEIPSDNPYVNTTGLDEIFAIGLRNTWKFSFDNLTNRLWAADVGQGSFEEINLIQKGMNLGWSRYEANAVVNSGVNINDEVTFPLHFYDHNQGDVSVTGGYVYRGSEISSVNPNIYNKYVYGDFASGRVWALDYNESTQEVNNELIFRTEGVSISSFGLDSNQELYFCNYTRSASIFKLIDGTTPPSGNIVNGFGNWESLNNIIESGVIRGVDVDINDNLYVVGSFSQISDQTANNIAVWSQATGWDNLGSGTDGTVNAVKIAPNGNVYVGGTFTKIDGVNAKSLAVWNGTEWSQVDSGIDGVVSAIEIDNNNGVYVGGIFKTVNGITANNIAYYNGSWSVLSGSAIGLNNEVRSLEIDTNGILYIGGNFDTAGGISANRIATWNGTSWGTLGSGTSGFVEAIIATDSDIYLGGNFITAGGKTVNRIARWSKSSSEFFTLDNGLSNNVTSLIHNGKHLYAAGSFKLAFNNNENIIVNRFARWDNNGWEALGPETNVGVDIKINSIVFSSNNDEKIFVAGNFSKAGNLNTNNIALWKSENVLNIGEFDNRRIYIFPNPASNLLYVSEKQDWILFDYIGNSIMKGNSISIKINNLANGLYIIKFKNGKSFKFIKK